MMGFYHKNVLIMLEKNCEYRNIEVEVVHSEGMMHII